MTSSGWVLESTGFVKSALGSFIHNSEQVLLGATSRATMKCGRRCSTVAKTDSMLTTPSDCPQVVREKGEQGKETF